MNKKFLLPLSLVTIFATTGCGPDFNRLKFNPIQSQKRFEYLEKINTAQKDNDNYKLPDVGSVKMTYQIDINGFVRLEGTSCKNISVSIDGPATFEWNIPNEYVKFTGPYEKYHIVRGSDKKLYCACDYFGGSDAEKKKHEVSLDIYNNKFTNLVAGYGDTYLSFGNEYLTTITAGLIPFFQFGITGFANEYMFISFTGDEWTAGNDLFGEGGSGERIANQFKEIYNEDKDKNGHFFRQIMGSDDDASLSCNFKGNTDLKDYRNLLDIGEIFNHATGYANFDFFTAWKNNIIYQNDYILDAHVLNETDNLVNLDIKIKIRQNFKEHCKIEKVDLSKY